jgi:muramoyltetrapeptide carboxypeptidase
MAKYLPKRLQPGDLIAVCSPTSPIEPESLQRALALLQSRGYRIRLMPHVYDRAHHLAGSDEHRAADLMEAWFDPDVAAIYCSRGGYGCARLLPLLDLDRMAAEPKMLIGFSDITTLHLALNRRGLATVHGPMGITLSVDRPDWVVESLFTTIESERWVLPSAAPRATTVVPGVAEGVLLGGCLILVCDTLGTPEAPDWQGALLLLEDVDEPPHRVDAMLTHLRNAGVLNEVTGVVVGEMTRTDERIDKGIGGLPWRDIVRERLGDLAKPVVMDFPFGHAPAMATLPLGVRARLDAVAGTLSTLEGHAQ